MSNKPFIDTCLSYFHLVGVHPEKSTFFSKSRSVVILFLTVIIFTFLLLDITINWNGIVSLLNGANSLVAYLQFIMKTIFFILYRKRLCRILTDLQGFWPVDEAEHFVRLEIEKIYGFIGKVLKSIKICYGLTMFSYFAEFFFTKERKFPFSIYQPFDLFVTPYYEIVYFLIFTNSVFAITFLLGFDILFTALITHVVCELKILKNKFAKIKINPLVPGEEEMCLREFSRLVDHHCFILQFIKQMRKFFSLMMLCIFFLSLFCICLSLFSLSGEGFPPRMDILAQCVTFLLCYAGELLIYCAGGNIITVESASVADSIYESHWWIKTQPKLRKAIALVILRSQKGERMTAGGMLELNLDSFTNVIRTSMSFFTLMHAVYSDGMEDA